MVTDLNMSRQTTDGQFTPLMCAVQGRNCTIVNKLLERHADVHAVSDDGQSALYLAAQAGCVNIVEILVRHHANVNAITVHGYTPLIISAQYGHAPMVEYLLSHGADANVPVPGSTDLERDAILRGHIPIANLLRPHLWSYKLELVTLAVTNQPYMNDLIPIIASYM